MGDYMKNCYHYDKLDSTSTYLKQNYKKYKDLTFLSANYQTKGHGRNNKEWISEYGENLLFSILIKDKTLISKYKNISLASAVCIYKILKELNVKNIAIKWPNDVYVNDKKIAGILLESISFKNDIEALVVGVGLNVNSNKFSIKSLNKPTSIYLETSKKELINDLKNKVYISFLEMFENIKKDDNSYLEIVRKNNYLKDKLVYHVVNDKKIQIKVIDINEDNSLKVKINNDISNLYSGEILIEH